MAAAIIPIATTLLPVLIPEIKALIQVAESAFAKKKPSPSPGPSPLTPTPPSGPAKAAAVMQALRSILNGLGIPDSGQPDAASLAGFIEAVFQELKQSGMLGNLPAPAPTPAPDPWVFNGQVIPPTPTYPYSATQGGFPVVQLSGKPVVVIP